MAHQRERPLHELLSRDMVDIYVGEDNTHWILHEKLLCYKSTFFQDIFYSRTSKNTAFGLPEEDEGAFELFVGWLYSNSIPIPKEEKDLSKLFDLYLMGEKWAIKGLITTVLETVRRFYLETDTWPGLRRVQYIYSETEVDSPMRKLLVGSIARMLILGNSNAGGSSKQDSSPSSMPKHWEKALRNNGQLAVDIILAVQSWKVDADKIPDLRKGDVVNDVKEIVQEAEGKGAFTRDDVDKGSLPNGVSKVDLEKHDDKGKEGDYKSNGIDKDDAHDKLNSANTADTETHETDGANGSKKGLVNGYHSEGSD